MPAQKEVIEKNIEQMKGYERNAYVVETSIQRGLPVSKEEREWHAAYKQVRPVIQDLLKKGETYLAREKDIASLKATLEQSRNVTGEFGPSMQELGTGFTMGFVAIFGYAETPLTKLGVPGFKHDVSDMNDLMAQAGKYLKGDLSAQRKAAGIMVEVFEFAAQEYISAYNSYYDSLKTGQIDEAAKNLISAGEKVTYIYDHMLAARKTFPEALEAFDGFIKVSGNFAKDATTDAALLASGAALLKGVEKALEIALKYSQLGQRIEQGVEIAAKAVKIKAESAPALSRAATRIGKLAGLAGESEETSSAAVKIIKQGGRVAESTKLRKHATHKAEELVDEGNNIDQTAETGLHD